MTELKIEQRPIGGIRPYWRNPRENDKAVDAVKASIAEFGMNQPLVIDAGGIIVAGHTRYRALKELGVLTVPVVVVDLPAEKVKAYRIADNKTAEFATWNMDSLIQELREVADQVDMEPFFGEDGLEELMSGLDAIQATTPSQGQIDRAAGDMAGQFTERSLKAAGKMVSVLCPHCGTDFNLDRDELLRQAVGAG